MEELDLKEISKCIYQRKNILIYILLIFILLGVLYTFIIKKPIYEVTAQILIDKTEASISNYIVSSDILQREEIEASFDKTTKVITITTEMENKEEALSITNEYIETLKTKLQETYNVQIFNIIETPQLPDKANNINYGKDICIFAFTGIGIYLVYIIIILSIQGITSSIEIENNTGISVLGEINLQKKQKKQVIPYDTNNIEIINQLKRIEANIELKKEDKRPKTILLTGTKQGVGTSYITKNLANQYAKLYEKVLIIDADTVSKTLSNYTIEKEEKGLTDIIKANKVDNIEKLIKTTQIENVSILPVGKEIIGEEMFLTETIFNILEEVKKKYNIVLIDSPTINKYVLTMSLASAVDTTIVVAQARKTKIEELEKSKKTIEKVGGNIAGVILNKII